METPEPNTVLRHLWGTSVKVFDRSDLELWHLRGNAGGASSLHRHEKKANAFHCTRGVLRVIQLPADNRQKIDILHPGASVSVAVGIPHRLIWDVDGEAYETYTGEIIEGDIERMAPGWRPVEGPP